MWYIGPQTWSRDGIWHLLIASADGLRVGMIPDPGPTLWASDCPTLVFLDWLTDHASEVAGLTEAEVLQAIAERRRLYAAGRIVVEAGRIVVE